MKTLLSRIYQHVSAQPVGESVALLEGQVGYALFESYYQRHAGLQNSGRVWDRLASGMEAIQTRAVGYSWKQLAEHTITWAAARRTWSQPTIGDAGLCHGAAGAAHLFSRFSRHCPSPVLVIEHPRPGPPRFGVWFGEVNGTLF